MSDIITKKKSPKVVEGAVRIISRKDGLRRAGVAHSGDVTHEPGTFTAEQLGLLQAEPLLTVIVGDAPSQAA